MLLLLSRFFCAIPLSWAMRTAYAVGWFWYYVLPIRKSVALRNVDRVFGDSLPLAAKRRIVRQCFVNLCMYAVEGLRMPILTAKISETLIDNHALSTVDTLLARGRGIVAVTAHIGNFDLLGCGQTVRGYPVHAIVKDITFRQGQLFWQKVRKQTGLGCVAPRGSRQAITELLQNNQIVAFLIDQHLPKHRAIVCEFFGQLAATTPAPVRFAMATGAPILPMILLREKTPGYHCIHVEPEFVLEMPYQQEEDNIRHNTERLNRLLEMWVLRWPEQWLWPHKRWKVHDAPHGWEIPDDLAMRVRSPT